MPPPPVPILYNLGQKRSRNEVVDELRRFLLRTEGVAPDSPGLPFGLPELDAHLPQGGLARGALHEAAPEAEADMPAAFGFVVALLSRMPEDGPVLFVLSSRQLARYGRPHGHGLNELGLDPARAILVETAEEKAALWAMEEALRSGVPAAVVGALGGKLDLKTSQRLHFAAGDSRTPLLLLRPADAVGSSAAATRWRITGAEAARDRFGLILRWRWRVELERCRNGRPGAWFVEFDHVAHRFSLAAAVADPAFSDGANPQALRRAGRS